MILKSARVVEVVDQINLYPKLLKNAIYFPLNVLEAFYSISLTDTI
jgi:hypothetical protein